jgi:hypothetical protein
MWLDIHTKFHEDWFRHSKVNKGGYTYRQEGDFISLLFFFQNKESRLKIDRFSLGPEICHFFVEPEDRLLCSLEPAIGPYPEAIRSSPNPISLSLISIEGGYLKACSKSFNPSDRRHTHSSKDFQGECYTLHQFHPVSLQ